MKKAYIIKRMFVLVLTVCMVLGMPLGALASEQEPAAVKEAADSLVLICMVCGTGEEDPPVIKTGTGFLIDGGYVVTGSAVTEVDPDLQEMIAESLGMSTEEFAENCYFHIWTGEGDCFDATVSYHDGRSDLALLKTDCNISGLKIRTSSEITEGDECYALFHVNFNDVLIAHSEFKGLQAIDGKEYVMYTSYDRITNVGTPLVDKSGSVIGITVGRTEEAYYAVSSDTLMSFLESAGVDYRQQGGSTPAQPGFAPGFSNNGMGGMTLPGMSY